VEREFQIRPGLKGFLKAGAAGLGAAMLGCGIYYAVLAITDLQVGLIAILVGFMVGHAVRWGARAKGGWAYQALAIFLTYMAIVTSYLPLVFKEMKEEQAGGKPVVSAQSAASTAGTETAPAVQPAKAGVEASTAAAQEELSFGEVVTGLILLFAFAAAIPFLAGIENIIGLAIIAFGLWEAWKLNKRPKLEISGPFAISAQS